MNAILNPTVDKRLTALVADPPHALAIHASKGAGKSYVAKYIISKILDIDDHSVENYPYLSILDASSKDSGIETIRELQKLLATVVPSNKANNRFVIIENFDELGHEGQNALLKTLEEPPTGTMIIITYANSRNVLPTIFSRVQNLELTAPSLDAYRKTLTDSYSENDVVSKFYMSEGSTATMLTLLEKSETPQTKAIETAKELLKQTRYERLIRVDSLLKQQEYTIMDLLVAIRTVLRGAINVSSSRNKLELTDKTLQRLELIDCAIEDASKNVQSKIVLSNLLSSL